MQPEAVGVEPDEYRNALRMFAGGVTIVTVRSPDGPHGMTASSFASVSLEPPLVLVSMDKSSHTRELAIEIGAFAVNMLAAGQTEIARRFAVPGPKPFDELAHSSTPGGLPLLDGILAWIECSVHEVIEAGDHDLVLGLVRAAGVEGSNPLIYFDRDYRSLG